MSKTLPALIPALLSLLTVGTLTASTAFASSNFASSREVTLSVPGATLSGTLQTPDGPQHRRPPVVLILPGSGPTNRDGDSLAGPGGTYRKLAANLAARGIASLRADKRGLGRSLPADPREEALSFDDYVNDARAWLDWLAQQPELGAVAVLGHSEGSTIALAALQTPSPAQAAVLLAGPGENLGATVRRQIGQNPANPPELVAETNRILDALNRGEPVPQVSPLLMGLFRPSVQPYLISSLKYDPARLIAAVKLPILIIQGDRDLQVRVEDAQLLQAAQPGAQVVLAPGVNHVLTPAPADPAGNFATYANAELPLARSVVTATVDFLSAALK